MYQISWETLILLRAPGPHTCRGLFSAHIWFCLDLDHTHVGLNHEECRVGFRVFGPEILMVQKCFKKNLFNQPTTIYVISYIYIYIQK